jgi:hypothetical protein
MEGTIRTKREDNHILKSQRELCMQSHYFIAVVIVVHNHRKQKKYVSKRWAGPFVEDPSLVPILAILSYSFTYFSRPNCLKV